MVDSTFHYAIPAELLQAIVQNLNGQPAGAVRGLLNALEAECAKQDRLRSVDTPKTIEP